MRPRKSAADDNWYCVKDARRRKQIQDRLAQRARRQRLADAARSSDNKASASPVATASLYSEPSSSSSGLSDDSTAVVQIPVSTLSRKSSQTAPLEAEARSLISSDNRLITLPILTITAAMYNNGRMLGLTCACSLVSKSSLQPPFIPSSLQPLPIQLDQVHFQFIDRFPIPRMRERMIILADEFNSEELVADLFFMPTFTIALGAKSWEGDAWSAEPEFIEKWGFLLE